MPRSALEKMKDCLIDLSDFELFVLEFFHNWPEVQAIVIGKENDGKESVYKLKNIAFKPCGEKERLIGRLLANANLAETIDNWQDLLNEDDWKRINMWENLLFENGVPTVPKEREDKPIKDKFKERREDLKEQCRTFYIRI